MRFVIDETSWQCGSCGPAQYIEALELMLDQLDLALEQGHAACYYADLFAIPVYQNKSFYELYDPASPVHISKEVQERIAGIFFGLQKWDEFSNTLPSSFEVEVDGGQKEVATSIAWAHEQTFQKPPQYIACLALQTTRKLESLDVLVNAKKSTLWFVGDSRSYCNYFRWLIATTTTSPAGMKDLSRSAFPSLDFADNAFNSIKDMSKPYRAIVGELVVHLGILSDHGRRIFQGSWERASAELGALGMNASDENGHTKGNSVARKERTAKVQDVDTVFWWHSKLELYIDRIHFNPDGVVNGGRIIVGIFCRHFKT